MMLFLILISKILVHGLGYSKVSMVVDVKKIASLIFFQWLVSHCSIYNLKNLLTILTSNCNKNFLY